MVLSSNVYVYINCSVQCLEILAFKFVESGGPAPVRSSHSHQNWFVENIRLYFSESVLAVFAQEVGK